jgi:hypothetical protein
LRIVDLEHTFVFMTSMPPLPPPPPVAPDPGAIDLPEGVPVPPLAEAAELCEVIDRLQGRLAVLVLSARDDASLTGGLSLQVWLEQVGRVTGQAARRLLGVCDVLRGMPATLGGLQQGWLSWTQTCQLAAAARGVTVAEREALDEHIGGMLDGYRRFHPDELCDRIWQIVDGWRPDRLARIEQAADRGQFLALQPQLEGGGSLYGQFDPQGFATICEALDTPLGPPVATPDPDDQQEREQTLAELDRRRRDLAIGHGRRLAHRFLQVCRDALAGWTGDGTRIPPRPSAHLVIRASDLLGDLENGVGWLLTTLLGGRLKASSREG